MTASPPPPLPPSRQERTACDDSWPGSDCHDDSHRAAPVPLSEPLAVRLAAQDIEIAGESLMHNRTFTVFPAILGKASGENKHVVVRVYNETNMPRLADVPLSGNARRTAQRRGAGSVEEVAEYAREMNILAGVEFRHPHLLRVLAFSKIPRDWVCTASYDATLFDYITRKGRDHAENWRACAKLFRMLADVAGGVAFLHHKNFVHKDINSKHVLFKRDFSNVVLSGYSLSKHQDSSGLLSSAKRGEIHWMDPLCFEHPYVFHNDTYSLGVVLGEILTGRAPFNLDPQGSVVKRLLAGTGTHDIDEATRARWPQLVRVYRATTCAGMSERPTAEQFRREVLSAVARDDALAPSEMRVEERGMHSTARRCVVQ